MLPAAVFFFVFLFLGKLDYFYQKFHLTVFQDNKEKTEFFVVFC